MKKLSNRKNRPASRQRRPISSFAWGCSLCIRTRHRQTRIHQPPPPRSARQGFPKSASPDALAGIKQQAAEQLTSRLGSRITDSSLNEGDVRRMVREALGDFIDDAHVSLTPEERRRLIREIVDEVLGLGPLQRLLDDPQVTEIMVNGRPESLRRARWPSDLTDARYSDDQLRAGHRAHRFAARPPDR